MCPEDIKQQEDSSHHEIQGAKVKEEKHEGFSHTQNLKAYTLLSARSVLL